MDCRSGSPQQVSRSPAAGKARYLGWAITLACLLWVFYNVHPERLVGHFKAVRWWWVVPAVAADITAYVFQALRWRLLLRPLGRLKLVQAARAVYTGLFASEVVPLRFGELVRAFLVARQLSLPLPVVLPSLAVERLLDGIWLALAIGLTAVFVPLPENLVEAGDVLGGMVLILTALLVFYFWWRKSAGPGSQAASGGREPESGLFKRLVQELDRGLQSIGRGRLLYLAFAGSFFVLFFQIVAFWLVMKSFGLRLSFWAGAVVLLIIMLGTAIPNAPANVGTYQFFCVVGLALFGTDKTAATGFSVFVFLILTLPLWLLGGIALLQSGHSLREIRKEVSQALEHRS